MKDWKSSKTVQANGALLLVSLVALLTSQDILGALPPALYPLIGAAVAAANIVLRIFYTTQPVSLGGDDK